MYKKHLSQTRREDKWCFVTSLATSFFFPSADKYDRSISTILATALNTGSQLISTQSWLGIQRKTSPLYNYKELFSSLSKLRIK